MPTIKPVWQCIYCYELNIELLTDEHIFPESLAGEIILPKSSCKECNKSTSSFEQHVSRVILGDLRIARNVHSKRPKERPATLNITVQLENGSISELNIPREDHPGQLPALYFDSPLIISGEDGKNWEITGRMTLTQSLDVLKKYNAVKISGTQTFNIMKFSQFLAKISHGLFTYRVGIDGFTPYLNKFITKRGLDLEQFITTEEGDYRRFIGCDKKNEFIEYEKIHKIDVSIEYHKGKWLCIVYIHLFSNFEIYDEKIQKNIPMPRYMIVAGEINDNTESRWNSGKWYYDSE